jgi:hypothetical protein
MLVGRALELFVSGCETLENDVIGAFREEEELAGTFSFADLANDDTHSLTSRGELEYVEELVLDDVGIVRSLNAEDVLVATEEDESDIGRSLNESGFVGRLCLVRDETVLFRSQYRVTETEVREEVVEVLRVERVSFREVVVDLSIVERGENLIRELSLDLVVRSVIAVRVNASDCIVGRSGGGSRFLGNDR